MFSAISQVPGWLPRFETRRALIIINVQNDSLYSKDDLYITKNHDFVDRLKALVPHFRNLGDVVWIRTELGTQSFPTSPGSAYIEQEVAKIDEKNREDRKVEEEQLEDDTVEDQPEDAEKEPPNPENGPQPPVQTYHPTSRSKAMMMRASARSRADQRTANMDVFNDQSDVLDEQISKPRKGPQPTFYIGGTLGAEIADQLLPVVDESKDLIVVKHHYSAFDQTSLLMSLRMRLVTDVYLCGCLTNVGVYATAADAVQHGFGVTVIEDCLGYRSEAKHEDAMRQMADIMGVNGIDSEEIIEEAGGRPPPDAEEPIFSGPGPEGIALTDISIDAKDPKFHQPEPEPEPKPEVEAKAIEVQNDARSDAIDVPELNGSGEEKEKAKNMAPKDPNPPLRPQISLDTLLISETLSSSGDRVERQGAADVGAKSLSDGYTPLPSPGGSSGRKRESWLSTSTHTLGPNDDIGSGDSRIIHDVLSSSLITDAFQRLKAEISWQTMHHRSGKVPRLVAVQGDIAQDGSVPVYRHPADESPKLVSFSPTVRKIRQEVEKLLKEPFNHALIQLYRDGNDKISEHSDKVCCFSIRLRVCQEG